MKRIKIGDKIVSEKGPAFFIADIGINHNGSLKLAKQLIDLAWICGADAVKFQKRDLESCIPQEVRNKIVETPWGEITYFAYKKKIEFSKDEYKKIKAYCKEKPILVTASSWDILSFTFLEELDVPFHKIPSALLTHKELLLKAKETKKPVFLSTGMSTEKQIKKAVALFGKDYPLVILHCNSEYPTKDEDINLSYIVKLKKMFPNYIIGYSGHEQGIAASLVAVALGAKVVERHITVNRSMWGTDQAASIEFGGLRRLTRDIKKIPTWLGDAIKKITENEKKIKKKLRIIEDF